MTFDISIHGRGGHGSRPDTSINPVDCFAAVVAALESMGKCEITCVDGGTASNIIPNTVHFRGTLENADPGSIRITVIERMVKHCQESCIVESTVHEFRCFQQEESCTIRAVILTDFYLLDPESFSFRFRSTIQSDYIQSFHKIFE